MGLFGLLLVGLRASRATAVADLIIYSTLFSLGSRVFVFAINLTALLVLMCQLHESNAHTSETSAFNQLQKWQTRGLAYVARRRWPVIIITQVKASAKGLPEDKAMEREGESGDAFGQTVTFMLIYMPLGAAHGAYDLCPNCRIYENK